MQDIVMMMSLDLNHDDVTIINVQTDTLPWQ